jgi:flagella synthesis protein FlgN
MSMNAMQQLSTILQSEISNSTALASLLKQERDALKISDVDKVSEITKLKQPYLLKLEQLARQREQLLSAVGFPAGKSGLEAFIANQEEADATRMSMQVSRLREVAKTCR